jgi:hypothetical protein
MPINITINIDSAGLASTTDRRLGYANPAYQWIDMRGHPRDVVSVGGIVFHPWNSLAAFRAVIRSGNERGAAVIANHILRWHPTHSVDRLIALFGQFGVALIYCEWLEEIAPHEDHLTAHDGARVSSYAFETRGAQCCACEDVFLMAATLAWDDPDDGQRICEQCLQSRPHIYDAHIRAYRAPYPLEDEADEEETPFQICSYNTNVLHLRKGFLHTDREYEGDRTLYLGVELEVEARHSDHKTVCQVAATTQSSVWDFAILKSDGSLAPHGFEIVSVPATKNMHVPSRWNKNTSLWDNFFDHAAPKLRAWSGTNGRCGMHVHLSRRAISHFTLGRMLTFVNDRLNRDFIELVAGRSSNSYSQMSPDKKILGLHGYYRPESRYEAINLANDNTYELRIFRGNVKKAGFMKNVEFSHALVMFCRQASIRDLTPDAFMDWMEQPAQRAEYPFLTAWMVTQQLIEGNTIRIQQPGSGKPTFSAFVEDDL